MHGTLHGTGRARDRLDGRAPTRGRRSKELSQAVTEHAAQDRWRAGERFDAPELEPVHRLEPARGAALDASAVHPGPVLAAQVHDGDAIVLDEDLGVRLGDRVVAQDEGVGSRTAQAHRARRRPQGNDAVDRVLELREEAHLIGLETPIGLALDGRELRRGQADAREARSRGVAQREMLERGGEARRRPMRHLHEEKERTERLLTQVARGELEQALHELLRQELTCVEKGHVPRR